MDRPQVTVEPNAELACQWWPELPNVWTPVGWKDHLFRFNVFYTGIVFAEPHPRSPFAKKHTGPWAGQGVQLTFTPSADGAVPDNPKGEHYQLRDANGNRVGYQGWNDHLTPVLWTKWRQPIEELNGVILRQDVFAHLSGGRDIETGIEPLFGWIRLSVSEMNPVWPTKSCGFLIKINAPHIRWSMSIWRSCTVMPDRSAYPRDLRFESVGEGDSPGGMLIEEDGKVRLAVLPGGAGGVKFADREPEAKDYHLFVSLPEKEGAFVDLLLPFIPVDRTLVETEMALGYDGALEESDRYWAGSPDTAVTVDVPEPLIRESIKTQVKLAEITAEKNPETGNYSMLTGSYAYTSVWATPLSMTMHMLMDPLGHHAAVEKYLRIYKEHQGSSTPPGPSYRPHPGYLCTPRSLASVDWQTDHGAILYTMCRHALLTGDLAFIEEYLPTILLACDFIKSARSIADHGGFPGLLPPASATDAGVPVQSVWTDGWNYKALVSTARLLSRIKHPQASELEQQAADYKAVFVRAFNECVRSKPEWSDRHGRMHRMVPSELTGDGGFHSWYYLDCGPLFLVYAGLVDADDELMREALLFFREGPNRRLWDPDGLFAQPPVLHHEMSSAEPCYSWNVFHSWQSGDRERFLEGMYSLFVAGMSRQTYSTCETRGGVTGLTPCTPAAYMARLAVIDDEIKEDELHLMRLMPLAWLTADRETAFVNMPTEYGPVTLRALLRNEGKELIITFSPAFRLQPKRIVLHVPPINDLEGIILNGRHLHWDGNGGSLDIGEIGLVILLDFPHGT